MSFSFNDAKWGTPTVGEGSGTLYWSADIVTGLNEGPGAYDQSDFNAALSAAFQAWEDVADVDFEMAMGGQTPVIEVAMGSLSGSTVGLASYSYQVLPGTDRIVSGDITLDSDETWAPFGEDDLSFYAVALHEIGHILGMNHVNDTSEIMNPFISTNALGDGDTLGIQTLYGTDASDPAPAPLPPVSDPAPPPAGSVPLAPDEDDGGGGILQWLFDLIASIFGGGKDDDDSAVAVATADGPAADHDPWCDCDACNAAFEAVDHESGCGCGDCLMAHDHTHDGSEHIHFEVVEVIDGETFVTVYDSVQVLDHEGPDGEIAWLADDVIAIAEILPSTGSMDDPLLDAELEDEEPELDEVLLI